MLVKILSDLHFHPLKNDFYYIDHGERVCILAGDISEGMRGVNWAEGNIPSHINVLYIPGNHEYYGHDIIELKKTFERYNQEGTHVTVLDNMVTEVGGVTFAGTTLWTDFMLYNDPLSGVYWATGLNDSSWIKYGGRRLNAYDMLRMHEEAFTFLQKVEAEVLITHYCPQFSESPKWKGHPLTPGFLTKIPEKIHSKFNYHIHGHTHDCFDYNTPYGTRVICNPRGNSIWENVHFNQEMVINI